MLLNLLRRPVVPLCISMIALHASGQGPLWPELEEPASWGEVELSAGWTISPVVAGGVCEGLFGIIDPSLVVGNNICMLWARPNAQGDWVISGWTSCDAPSAIAWLRAHHGDASVLADVDGGIGVAEPVAPSTIVLGLIEGDPFLEIVEEFPEPIVVEAAVAAGAAGALDLSSLMLVATDCGPVVVIDAQLSAAALGLLHGLGIAASSELDEALVQAFGED